MGILIQHSVPYTPQQNGVDERKNKSLKEMATCLLEARNIPPYLWVEIVNYVSYIHNIFPHKSVIEVTPFEALMGHKTNALHMRVYGSISWERIPSDKRKSFQPQSGDCIILRYEDDAKDYKIMDIETKRCFIEQSV